MSWTLIEHQALSSSAASVTLGSGGTIPQTYKSLKLLITGRSSQNSNYDYVSVRFNGSSSAIFSYRELNGNGSAATSASGSSLDYGYLTWIIPAATATTSTFGNAEVTIPNYSGSTNKPFSVDGTPENNASGLQYLTLNASLWGSTAAITSITVYCANGVFNFVSGSTFTLYGLA